MLTCRGLSRLRNIPVINSFTYLEIIRILFENFGKQNVTMTKINFSFPAQMCLKEKDRYNGT